MIQRKKIKCKTCGKDCYTGKRNLCSTCDAKVKKEKVKVEKKKVRAKIKRETTVTDKTLDTVVSQFVRTAYKRFCHATCSVTHQNPVAYKDLQNCHCIPRSRSLFLKYNILNLLPGCPGCNKFSIGHEVYLYKWLCHYWGKELVDYYQSIEKQRTLKLNGKYRKYLYDVFKDGLAQAELLLENEDYTGLSQLREEVFAKYEKIIEPITFSN